MSRIGKKAVEIPPKVEVQIAGQTVHVKGPKGELSFEMPPTVRAELSEGKLQCRRGDESRAARAQHGMVRAILANMVRGVAQGYTKVVIVQGVGYKAEQQGQALVLTLGHSHPDSYPIPAGVAVQIDPKTYKITINGADKQAVGRMAKEICRFRPAEPYRMKGLRLEGVPFRQKVRKTVGA